MQPSVIAALAAGATLVTANQRLARHLAAEYAADRERDGVEVWEAPAILPWNAWLTRYWEESFGLLAGDVPQLLLSEFQEQVLWEEVIRADAEPLLQIPSAARAAREAWQLLHAWRLPRLRVTDIPSEDAAAFGRWAQAYERRCATQHWLDGARLPDAVREGMARGRLVVPARLLIGGFDELTPQQQQLLDAVRTAGGRVETLAGSVPAARVARLACADALAELRAAAAWVRSALEDGVPRVGIVVPDLRARRATLMRVFDELLVPQVLLPGSDTVRPYNVSLGDALSRIPVVHAALTALECGISPFAVTRAGWLLRSPFFAGHREEAGARAQIDARLRRAGEEDISSGSLTRAAQAALESPASAAPRLAAQLRAWRDALPSMTQRLAPSAWSEIFARLLVLLGWPGDVAPDHDQLRVLEAWRDLLAELSAQDVMTPRVTYAEALVLLRRMASERVFQPPTPVAPVQVLGLLEAAGLEFDRLWVMGLDDESWPPSPRPNPFLPLAWQRSHAMPHASAERELEFARRLTERLTRSAREVIVSYPENAGDEPRRPSPLIGLFPALRAADLPTPATGVGARQYVARAVETCRDEQAPELAPGSRASGGTTVLQAQAACPFRAFAQLRLGARSPEEPEPGLDARARGQLVHYALKALWESLQSHERLCTLAAGELDAAIHAAIARAIETVARDRAQTLSGRFRDIEAQRLADLLHAWVAIERQRAPFRLLAAEEERTLVFGGLTLTARMDRIDALASGGCAIMDYKTGRAEPKDWQGERPDEPQLPAYAVGLQAEQPVSALLFARLRPGELGFRGVAARPGLAPRVPAAGDSDAAWAAQLDAWHATLDALAESFRRGDARVEPKEFPKTCEHCGLDALCRVHERGFAPQDSGETGDD